MIRRVIALSLLIACGKHAAHDDAPTEPLAIDSAVPRCAPVSGTTISMRRIVYGCNQPGAPAPPMCMADAVLLVTSPPNDPRLFAVERDGKIFIIDHEVLNPEPFLDISADPLSPIVAGGEQGLLGLAFHPSYATNGKFYVYYTRHNPAGNNPVYMDVVAEFTVSATDPNKADPASAKVIISIPDPSSNHNGGMIEFGSDGYLYISDGDGGGSGDPNRNAQNPNVLLGKMSRIDVDHPANGKPYGIPPDNPFVAGGAAPEVWVIGLRNPWRWSFDRATGDMWIADVGQNLVEELDVLFAGQQAGKNLGWSMYEGSSCFGNYPCDPTGMTFPANERPRAMAWGAIVGGQVYRGSCYPDLVGRYFYTDYVKGGMATAVLQADHTLTVTDLQGTFPVHPASIHADAFGELYETEAGDVTGAFGGSIWHIEAGP
jgi:glucose/arabinose dehydrogenase